MVGYSKMLAFALVLGAAPAAAVSGNEPVPQPVVALLRKHFRFDEMTALLGKRPSRSQVAKELADRYSLDGSQQQGDATVEGYRSRTAPPVGLTLSYFGADRMLLVANVLGFDPVATATARELKTRSLDSVDTEAQPPAARAKLYFLGVYRLDAALIVKVVLREDAMGSGDSIYSVQYGVSESAK